jgi:hypothetical protein
MSLLALPSSFGGRIESESVDDFIGIRIQKEGIENQLECILL